MFGDGSPGVRDAFFLQFLLLSISESAECGRSEWLAFLSSCVTLPRGVFLWSAATRYVVEQIC